MRVDAPIRRWRRLSAFVQLLLFAFSASTSLLPCANEMPANATAHHATAPSSPANTSDVSEAYSRAAAGSHSQHVTHGAVVHDAPEYTSAAHHPPTSPPSSDACPWVLGCTGLVQFAFESTWRVLETTPVVSAPTGVTLRAVYAEREVESPPPRA